MLDAGEYSPSSSAECPMSSFNTSVVCSILNLKRKDSKNNKRTFSDEQIKSLETIFDTDAKLEPKKKLLLARQLGLQPRQVAIWFQNKRARRKSKQLQRDYNLLQSNYDDLASQFEILKKGRQTLIHQLQKLRNDLIDKSDQIEAAGHESFRDEASDDGPGNSFSSGLENDGPNGAAIANMIKSSCAGDQHDVDKNPSLLFLDLEITGYGIPNGVLSDDDSINNEDKHGRNPESYLGLEAEAAAELPLNTVESPDSCNLTEPEEWGRLAQQSYGYKWWGDIWP